MRTSLRILLLAFLLASCQTAEPPPNFVLIISDDQGWMDHGFMGDPVVQTPNLDQLASEGLLFTRGYVPTAVCRPSLASIITGLEPHVHGITGNDPPGGRQTMLDPEVRGRMTATFDRWETIPELLAEKGYVSFQSGKWWEGDPLDHGFTAAMTHGDVRRGGRHGDDGLSIGREGMQPVFDFIASAGDRPFFVWYAPFLPHQPHDPPERLVERFAEQGLEPEVARYYAMILWLDETVGALRGFLAKQHLEQNTVLLYVVDNGWVQPIAPQRMADTRAKMSPYEAGIRTPVLLHWPGHVGAARNDTLLAGSLDLAPTILRMAGLEPPPQMRGVDLRDVDDLNRRNRLFGALFAHTAVRLDDPSANLKYRTVVTRDGWKLVLPWVPNRDVPLMIDGAVADWMAYDPELYDVLSDPFERDNLASDHPEIVDRLRRAIDDWWDPGRLR